MTTVEMTSEITVEPIRHLAEDRFVAEAARVSTLAEIAAVAAQERDNSGLIRRLMAEGHGSPFEHGYFCFRVHAPLYVMTEHLRHRIGWCLAGDTEVWCESIAEKSGRTIRKRPIAELYRNWHHGVKDSMGRTRLLASCRNFSVRTLDESTGQFVLSKVVNIYENGLKSLLRLTTKDGQTIKASTDHLFWTAEGWRKLGELTVGDLVARNGKVAIKSGQQYPPSLRRGIGVWTSMQRPARIKPFDTCYLCKGVFAYDELELDHIVPVAENLAKALDVNNLAPCCVPCHDAKTVTEQALAKRGPQTAGVVWTPIVSIEDAGEEATYDLELEGPMRGFVANGLVVHNSYNGESGRYKTFEPVFYTPPADRGLTQVGKAMDYSIQPGTPEQRLRVETSLEAVAEEAWEHYEWLLDRGIAREVARQVLPTNLMTTYYTSCNPRSLMAFLELRTSANGGHPLWEIEQVAQGYEVVFAEAMPVTYAAFDEFGGEAP